MRSWPCWPGLVVRRPAACRAASFPGRFNYLYGRAFISRTGPCGGPFNYVSCLPRRSFRSKHVSLLILAGDPWEYFLRCFDRTTKNQFKILHCEHKNYKLINIRKWIYLGSELDLCAILFRNSKIWNKCRSNNCNFSVKKCFLCIAGGNFCLGDLIFYTTSFQNRPEKTV